MDERTGQKMSDVKDRFKNSELAERWKLGKVWMKDMEEKLMRSTMSSTVQGQRRERLWTLDLRAERSWSNSLTS